MPFLGSCCPGQEDSWNSTWQLVYYYKPFINYYYYKKAISERSIFVIINTEYKWVPAVKESNWWSSAQEILLCSDTPGNAGRNLAAGSCRLSDRWNALPLLPAWSQCCPCPCSQCCNVHFPSVSNTCAMIKFLPSLPPVSFSLSSQNSIGIFFTYS